MDRERKRELAEASLERAAGQIGDITVPAMERYYALLPEARAMFVHHDPYDPHRLEGSMVEQALFCLLLWFESPAEIRILLETTVPHHIETLNVDERTFSTLLEVVCDIVGELIPPQCEDERAVWAELRADLLKICAKSAADIRYFRIHHQWPA